MTEGDDIKCPNCPTCGGPPMELSSMGVQRFCEDRHCSRLSWDPRLGLDVNRLTHDAEGPSFTCPRCGAASRHPGDVKHRYCGRCHLFADETELS